MIRSIQDQFYDGQNPWLSIVIPVYNAENHLKQCIESILCQEFQNFELILVDDGSEDNSWDICLHYTQQDYRVHSYHHENGGSYKARLFGVSKAKGEFFTFCDADDYYPNSKVFTTIFESLLRHPCLACQFGHQKKYNHLKKKSNTVNELMIVEDRDVLMHEYPKLICSFWKESHLTTNVWNKVYHKTLSKSLPNYEQVEHAFWGDDQVMNLYLLGNASSILYLPDSLYVYRQGTGGTSSFSLNTMKDLDFIKRHQFMFLEGREDKDQLEKILFSELAGWFFIWVRQAESCLNDDELKGYIERTLKYPSFVLAHDYYLEHDNETWEAAELLRQADAEMYIKRARQEGKKSNSNIKQIILEILKKIYKTL